MNLYIPLIAFFTIVSGNSMAELNIQQSPPNTKKGTVVVLGNKYHYYEEIKIIALGKLADLGDCGPTVKLGLIKKNANGWDTVVQIAQIPTLMCGFDSALWHGDTVNAQINNFPNNSYFKTESDIPGTYRFTYMYYKKNKSVLASTNEFELEL